MKIIPSRAPDKLESEWPGARWQLVGLLMLLFGLAVTTVNVLMVVIFGAWISWATLLVFCPVVLYTACYVLRQGGRERRSALDHRAKMDELRAEAARLEALWRQLRDSRWN